MTISGRASETTAAPAAFSMRREPHAHRRRVTVQPLEMRQDLCRGSEIDEPRGRQLLHRDALLKILERQAAEGPRKAVRRQGVVGTAAVVARGFRRPMPQEYRARGAHPAKPAARFANFEQQVLGGIVVGDFEGGFEAVDEDEAHDSDRLRQDRPA